MYATVSTEYLCCTSYTAHCSRGPVRCTVRYVDRLGKATMVSCSDHSAVALGWANSLVGPACDPCARRVGRSANRSWSSPTLPASCIAIHALQGLSEQQSVSGGDNAHPMLALVGRMWIAPPSVRHAKLAFLPLSSVACQAAPGELQDESSTAYHIE